MTRRLVFVLSVITLFQAVYGQRNMEQLDRGLVAVATGGHVFLSWRIPGEEWIDHSYRIYRNGSQVAETGAGDPSNYIDSQGSAGDMYAIAAVFRGEEKNLSAEVPARSQAYYDVPINLPPGGVSPDGSYTYSANDASAADLDGDGKMEIILKWDPSNAHDNAHSGYTGDVILDAYRLDGTHLWRVNLGRNIRAGAHYTQFMVADFDGDGKAEMACKTADGTIDGLGNIIGDPDADYRGADGRILSGPEFLTVFNGETGEAMQTIDFEPARGWVGAWGDTYGNRVDRFLAGTPYLDGEHPSILMCRGYYEKTMLAAFDWKDGQLTMRWLFNADESHQPEYTGQGNHNLTITDVDNDGKDEIVYGSMTVDDNGQGLYSTGLHHGDAMHVSDMDPDYPGLEVFAVHEDGVNGVTFREAATGRIIWQHTSPDDVGRGVAADINGTSRGFESWATSGLGMYNSQGDYEGARPNSVNFRVWWDGDLYSELLDGTSIRNYSTTILSATGCSSNNGTKSTPALSADLFGDWREEVIWRVSTNDKLRIFTTTDYTEHRLYTLLHDSQYRNAVAWQNVAYNQPPHTGFYMENDMVLPVPLVFRGKKWKGNSSINHWDHSSANFIDSEGLVTSFGNGDTAIFSFGGEHLQSVEITSDITPGLVVVASPDDYHLGGSGSLAGKMNLYKTQKGSLTISGEHTYTGKTIVTDGAFIVNGSLDSSRVFVSGGLWGGLQAGTGSGGRIGGSGTLKNGLVVQNRAAVLPGLAATDTLFVAREMVLQNKSRVYFDLTSSPDGDNDVIMVNGDLSLGEDVTFVFNLLDDTLTSGSYALIPVTGEFTGGADGLTIRGLDGYFYSIRADNKGIYLELPETRDPASITWTGAESSEWSLSGAMNWEMGEDPAFFLPGDEVVFDENGAANPDIEVSGLNRIGGIRVTGGADYTVAGAGYLTGQGGIQKSGDGTFKIFTSNSFSGGTEIQGGSLVIDQIRNGDQESNIGMAGTLPGALIIDGATLEILKDAVTDKGMSIGAGGATLKIRARQVVAGEISGSGTLVKDGKGTLALSRANPFTGDVSIVSGTIEFVSDEANSSGTGSGTITLHNGTIEFYNNNGTSNTTNLRLHVPENGYGVLYMDSRVYSHDQLTGAGELDVHIDYIRTEFNGDWSAFEGKINVIAGVYGADFRVNNDYGYGKASVTFNERVKAYHIDKDTIVIGNLLSMAGSRMQDATWIIGEKGGDSRISGAISGNRIHKIGPGRLIIDGNNNNYNGGTLVEEGTLEVGNLEGSATGTGNVEVMEEAVLSGSGMISGAVEMKSGSFISPGIAIGKLTINNTISMEEGSVLFTELSNELKTNDLLACERLEMNNTDLYMINISAVPYEKGDRFTVFEADQFSGNFANIYPLSPGEGLQWDTTNLRDFGMIEVVEKLVSSRDKPFDDLLEIYPNPTSGEFWIAEHGGEQISGISIIDAGGSLVQLVQPEKTGNPNFVNLSGLPGGSYLVQMNIGEQIITKQLILLDN